MVFEEKSRQAASITSAEFEIFKSVEQLWSTDRGMGWGAAEARLAIGSKAYACMRGEPPPP
jgi:hypothetical protein